MRVADGCVALERKNRIIYLRLSLSGAAERGEALCVAAGGRAWPLAVGYMEGSIVGTTARLTICQA